MSKIFASKISRWNTLCVSKKMLCSQAWCLCFENWRVYLIYSQVYGICFVRGLPLVLYFLMHYYDGSLTKRPFFQERKDFSCIFPCRMSFPRLKVLNLKVRAVRDVKSLRSRRALEPCGIWARIGKNSLRKNLDLHSVPRNSSCR